jgi:3',5'-cyclic-AMP phosphodiesterase
MKARRTFLKKTLTGAIAASLVPQFVSASEIQPSKTKRALRIAHITDVHITDTPLAERNFAKVLREINQLKDKPDLILNTGDTVMDENKQTRETVALRWSVWDKITTRENRIPIYSALGNHDVWYGPDEKLDEEYKTDKRYGKQWAIEKLNLPNRYYSFELKGWKFIALDSINGQIDYSLDTEQFNWLDNELSATPMGRPICVFNHVPLLSVCATMYLIERNKAVQTSYPVGDQHTDTKEIKNLFQKYQKVKLCLSGHVHYVDSVDYLGIKYVCNGAVSGNWWQSPLKLDDFPPAYAIIDLYEDGSSNCQTVYYQSIT